MKLGIGLGVSFGSRAASGATPFAPQLDANTKLWLDTRTGVTSAAGAVSGWADQGPVGDSHLNLAQTTAANKPTLVTADANFNGEDSVSFDGGDFMVSTTWTASVAQPFTVYVVFRFSVNDGGYLFDGFSNRIAMTTGSAGNGFVFAGSDTPLVSTSVDTTYVAAITFDGASSKHRLNTLTATTFATSPGANVMDSLTLGARFSNTSCVTGKVAAFAVRTGAAEDAIIQGLATRYGVTLT